MEKWAGISKGIRKQLRNQEVWKGQADHTNKLKVDVFAAAPGVGPPRSPRQQPDERWSQIQACHQEACGGWTDIEGEQQSLPLTQSWLSDPGSLSIHL